MNTNLITTELEGFNLKVTFAILGLFMVLLVGMLLAFNYVGQELNQEQTNSISVSDEQNLDLADIIDNLQNKGIATIPAGQNGVFVSFPTKLQTRPYVFVTPVSYLGNYTIREVSDYGFLIEIEGTTAETVYFNWLAII